LGYGLYTHNVLHHPPTPKQYFVIIGCVTGFGSFIDSLGAVYVTEYTLSRVRHEYMKSLLRQDMYV
jgi:hypothetical protein